MQKAWREPQSPALWKKKQSASCCKLAKPTRSYLHVLQYHKSEVQPVMKMIPIPQGEASARGVPEASLHWALKIIFYSIRLVTEAPSSHGETIEEPGNHVGEPKEDFKSK